MGAVASWGMGQRGGWAWWASVAVLTGALGVTGTGLAAKASEVVIAMAGDSPCVAVFLNITENGRALGAFSVQSSGMVKRGQDYANLPVLVAGRTYEFTGSCIASTKFTQSLSLKFKADGRAVNLVFRKSGFTLSAGK